MKKIRLSLLQQLLLINLSLITIVLISLLIILPNFLLPIYEENIYNDLKQPLRYMNKNNDIANYNNNIGYIYVNTINNNVIKYSSNLDDIIEFNDNDNINTIINYMFNDYGKFTYNSKTYYYYTSNSMFDTKITITNDTYINKMKTDIFITIMLIMGITFGIVSIIIILWSNNLANKIKYLRNNVNNIDNDNYKNKYNSILIDELYNLNLTIEDMRNYLKEQVDYKNQMYQNISHDFKTPITVMKSYIEASEDGIESKDKTLNIIKEQTNKLENKVHSLLYLNKLNYIQSKTDNLNIKFDVKKTIYASVDKFKVNNKNIDFIVETDKDTIFNGSEDMWEAIVDNILNNFTRYAKSKIRITIKNKKIILFNDGPNIDKKLLNNIFTPYEKGINGIFGLGLSIVKKTLQFLNYDISIENTKEGVKFIIK